MVSGQRTARSRRILPWSQVEAPIKQAGFGSMKNRTLQISLTEAETAAVCVSKQDTRRVIFSWSAVQVAASPT
jgi:hypothetical protein